METTIINGVDTISSPIGDWPMQCEVSFDFVRRAESIREQWNDKGMAIIPFCMVCKEALVWHQSSDNGVLFHCSKCKREWIKDGEWNKDSEKYALKLAERQEIRKSHGK